MNALLRKEWHENRAVVPMSALLMAVLFGLLLGYRHYATNQGQPMVQPSTLFEPLLLIFWAIPAALCSTSIIASEAGAGTLQFLNSIPLSRNKIWWGKMLTAFYVVALCSIVSAAAFVLLYVITFATGYIHEPLADALRVDSSEAELGLCITLPIFAVGSVTTVLVDRTITAMVLLIVISAVLSIIVMAASNAIQSMASAAIPAPFLLILLVVVLSLLYSNRVFVRRATLLSRETFSTLLGPLIDVVVLGAAIWLSLYWLTH